MTMTLTQASYMQFPFAIGRDGAETSNRAQHVREQIEQVILTSPRERVFRPSFGAGVDAIFFENNQPALWEAARKRLLMSLAEVLHGEVNPETISIDIFGADNEIYITINYQLTTINQTEQFKFKIY